MKELKALVKRRLTLNGYQNISDDKIDYAIEEAVQRVLNFCNLTTLPKELHYTIAKIVGDMLIPSEDKSQAAKVVKVGDTSVEFGRSYSDVQLDKLMTTYESELYSFRQVKWG